MRRILALTVTALTLTGCAFAPIVVATSTPNKAAKATTETRRVYITYGDEEFAVDTVKTKVGGTVKRTKRHVTVDGQDYTCVAFADCLFRVQVLRGDAKD